MVIDKSASLDEIAAISAGDTGLYDAIMEALRQNVTLVEMGTFLRNTPGKKRGSELWAEFLARQGASPKPKYEFIDFVREVIAEAKKDEQE